MSGDPAHGLKGDDLILSALTAAEKKDAPEKLSPFMAAMARLDARLNGKDRRELRRAQHKVNGTKESFAEMAARLAPKVKR